MRNTIYILFLFSLLSCSSKEWSRDNIAIVMLSKSDCITCRRSMPVILNCLQSNDVSIGILNNNCREVELNAVRTDFETIIQKPKVFCDEELRKKLQALVGECSTSLIIYREGEIIFSQTIKKVDIREIENLFQEQGLGDRSFKSED